MDFAQSGENTEFQLQSGKKVQIRENAFRLIFEILSNCWLQTFFVRCSGVIKRQNFFFQGWASTRGTNAVSSSSSVVFVLAWFSTSYTLPISGVGWPPQCSMALSCFTLSFHGQVTLLVAAERGMQMTLSCKWLCERISENRKSCFCQMSFDQIHFTVTTCYGITENSLCTVNDVLRFERLLRGWREEERYKNSAGGIAHETLENTFEWVKWDVRHLSGGQSLAAFSPDDAHCELSICHGCCFCFQSLCDSAE